MTLAFSRNNLDRETSPYLLQHKDNPVHWQAWRPEVLAAAKAAKRPILLSVGYAACHWCHVMAHESFDDPDTAEVMNALFVNIKVDREERPDIDAIYQTALQLLGEQGGWPLTMFLDSDGAPFWGGTYFPKEQKYGRPAFADMLRRVAEVYATDGDTVAKNRATLMNALKRIAQKPAEAGPPLSAELLDRMAERIGHEIDPVFGGIGQAPKFPQTGLLEVLWRGYLRTGKRDLRDAVVITLTQMSQGGIYDHLGGGYARYATDARWLVPHFEKMLYDNALLIDLLALVQPEVKSPLFDQRLRETIGWVLWEMTTDGGGFAASFDADSEGEEGKFYTWSAAEIEALLGPGAPIFKAHYDVTPTGNFEGRNILNRSQKPALGTPDQEAALAEMRATLANARERRVKPGWDDKVLADWNGLMIAALVRAGQLLHEPDWLLAAIRAFTFIEGEMIVDGRLRHSWREGRAQHAALLDDYANLARAALFLSEATGESAYLTRAESFVEILDRHYWDPRQGGYFLTAADAEGLIARTRQIADNATPAGNATMLEVLTRLQALTGKDAYGARAAALIEAFAGELARNFFPLGAFLNAIDLYLNPLQVVILGRRGDPDTDELTRALGSASLANLILNVIESGDDLPPGHPAAGKTKIDGKPTAYVCVGQTCSLPVAGAEKLKQELPQP